MIRENQVKQKSRQDYLNLIKSLLNCPNGQLTKVLQANSDLIDEELVNLMQELSKIFAEEGNQRGADLANKLAQIIGDQNIVNLNETAIESYQHGDYRQAAILADRALGLARKLWGHEHPHVASTLSNLASIYHAQGYYPLAETFYKEALTLSRYLWGDEDAQVITIENNLAGLYQTQGYYVKAESLYKRVLTSGQRLWGDEHPNLVSTLNNLASVYHDQGRYNDAKCQYEQALNLSLRFWEKENFDSAIGLNLAICLNNLADIYRDQGCYNCPEILYEQALHIWLHFYGDRHPHIATALNNLALVYQKKGRYDEAEFFAEQALKIRQNLLGDQHPDVASSLNNLAFLYYEQGYYSQAKSLCHQALEIKQKIHGKQHLDVAKSLNNLALIYHAQGEYKKAKSVFEKAFNLCEYILGKEHPLVADILNNLASLYNNIGHYEKAEVFYKRSLKLTQYLEGEDHPHLAQTINNFAVLLAATDRGTEALKQMIQATKITDRTISQVFAISSENDRLAYLQTIKGNFYAFLSLVNSHLSNSPEAKQAAYDLVLKRKALTAAAFAAFNYALYSDRYSHLTPQFKQWQSLRAEQIHLIYSPPLPDPEITEDEFRTRQAEYQKRLSDLETESKNLEKLLASQVPEIQLQQELETANRRAVALELPEGSTLVEFVRFDVFDFQAIPVRGESQWKPARYLAFILPAKQPDKVEMIDLGEAEHIDKLLRVFRSYFSGKGDLLNMADDDEETPTFRKYNPAFGMELRKAIFDPISALIDDSKYLLVSPDGELNLLPFQLLPDETGTQFLIDEYTISYLSVGRDILRSHFQPTRPATAPLIIADPDFDLGNKASFCSEDFSPQSAEALTTNQVIQTLAGNSLERAPGTRFLGEAVAKKLEVSPYFDAEAVETQITKSQSPSILLIATHGVFLPDLPHQPSTLESRAFGSRFSATKVENPMLRSGLALAGANIWLSGGTLPEKAGKGFLFAQDVAALDLWANELTVLSACNTAIGDVKIGEGVFGLRRAFAVAGTKTLVMSLWPVPDKATALLMERFFDNLERGFGRSNALLESQNYIRNITVRELGQSELGREVLKELLTQNDLSCQEKRPLEHPFYWGAWVCQGETTELKNVLSLKIKSLI